MLPTPPAATAWSTAVGPSMLGWAEHEDRAEAELEQRRQQVALPPRPRNAALRFVEKRV